MDKRALSFWSLPLLAWAFAASEPLLGGTISAAYSFTGSAQNVVIANGFLTADGFAVGDLNTWSGVMFDTRNDINLTTLQNYGTFTMIFPNGDTAFGDLYENDVNVSLATFSGPFTQLLTFTGGTGQFAQVTGSLNGGGFIFPTSYTTSGTGTLAAPALSASPEPDSGLLLFIGLAVGAFFLPVRNIRRTGFDVSIILVERWRLVGCLAADARLSKKIARQLDNRILIFDTGNVLSNS